MNEATAALKILSEVLPLFPMSSPKTKFLQKSYLSPLGFGLIPGFIAYYFYFHPAVLLPIYFGERSKPEMFEKVLYFIRYGKSLGKVATSDSQKQ